MPIGSCRLHQYSPQIRSRHKLNECWPHCSECFVTVQQPTHTIKYFTWKYFKIWWIFLQNYQYPTRFGSFWRWVEQGIICPSHRGCSSATTFLTPPTPSATVGVKEFLHVPWHMLLSERPIRGYCRSLNYYSRVYKETFVLNTRPPPTSPLGIRHWQYLKWGTYLLLHFT